jgi:hypothetical protein
MSLPPPPTTALRRKDNKIKETKSITESAFVPFYEREAAGDGITTEQEEISGNFLNTESAADDFRRESFGDGTTQVLSYSQDYSKSYYATEETGEFVYDQNQFVAEYPNENVYQNDEKSYYDADGNYITFEGQNAMLQETHAEYSQDPYQSTYNAQMNSFEEGYANDDTDTVHGKKVIQATYDSPVLTNSFNQSSPKSARSARNVSFVSASSPPLMPIIRRATLDQVVQAINSSPSEYAGKAYGQPDQPGGQFSVFPLESQLQVSYVWEISASLLKENDKIVSLPFGPLEWSWQVM